MSLSRDVLLFSILLMLWAVQIETSGYGNPDGIILASLGVGLIGLAGSFVSSLTAIPQRPDSDPSE